MEKKLTKNPVQETTCSEQLCGKVDLTIITPAYNRCDRIGTLYESLTRQGYQNFQWLVIDDGSIDGTETWFRDLIANKKASDKFEIDYHRKANGGKHTALNYAHPYIKGRWMTIVDSDDYLTDDAVETIVETWKKYEKDSNIGGITFQRQLRGGRCAGALDKTIIGETISTFAEKTNQGMSGDHCETLRTDLFKKVKFPEYQGEKFVAEGAMWYLATRGYNVVYSDRVVYMCEYLEGGLTKSGRAMRIRNPKGGMWHAYPLISKDFRLKIRLKNALLFNAYSFFAKCEWGKARKLECKVLLLCARMPGYILYVFWKHKYV